MSRPLLSEQVHQVLRQRILDGTLKPGDRLLELNIARELGVSQAPVREALRLLTREGLALTIRRRGTFVVALDPRETLVIYRVRAELEVQAGERFLEIRSSPEGERTLAHMEKELHNMRQSAHENEFDAFIDHDMAFHRALVASLNSPAAGAVWSVVETVVRRLVRITNEHYYSSLRELAESHVKILDALRTGKKADVRRVLRRHILITSRRVL